MAEIIGLAASVIALIQVVDGLTTMIPKYINTVKGTKEVLIPLLGRLFSLSRILATFETELEMCPTKSIELEYLSNPLGICRAI